MIWVVFARTTHGIQLFSNVLDNYTLSLSCHECFTGENELLDKVKVIQQYNPEVAIAIGDSVTDLNMALSADLVFARSRLIKYLEARQKSFIAWDNFFDVRDYLRKYLK